MKTFRGATSIAFLLAGLAGGSGCASMEQVAQVGTSVAQSQG
ncbi:MAG: hypothetical protein H6Q84_1399, partial [Deltaproteobacteria bacterium]|nr:hypothetical protein [Deltaproteobacteria bacterium]MBP2678342.1 hypothetical protein [Deltaproteobacteria bacterium]MBP2685542.1 hypothetical protein [Deltaproteobacteria bacterium]